MYYICGYCYEVKDNATGICGHCHRFPTKGCPTIVRATPRLIVMLRGMPVTVLTNKLNGEVSEKDKTGVRLLIEQQEELQMMMQL